MYRSGWSIGTASVSTQAIVAAILVIVGLVHFGEHVRVRRRVFDELIRIVEVGVLLRLLL
jgi:hypothetical protein